MIEVIDEKPIPIYEATCPECGSTLEYTAASVFYSHITCPVCNCLMWAMTLRPKRYQARTAERIEESPCNSCDERSDVGCTWCKMIERSEDEETSP